MWILYHIWIFTLKLHKNFAGNLSKQIQRSGKNHQVPGLIIKKGSSTDCTQDIWTLFVAELIEVLW